MRVWGTRCTCIEKRGTKINLFGTVIGIKRALNIVVTLLILFVVVRSSSFMCKATYLSAYCEPRFLHETIYRKVFFYANYLALELNQKQMKYMPLCKIAFLFSVHFKNNYVRTYEKQEKDRRLKTTGKFILIYYR